ncbi:LPXTG cell wall anchor domain-containing protein, partial [Actinomyces sp. CCUG 33915]
KADNAGNNGGNQPSAAASPNNNGSTAADGATGTAGQDAQGANTPDSKAGAGQKNSSIAKPGGNAQAGQGQAAAAAAATGGGRLPLTGASMTAIVLAVAAIALGGGFILVRRRMAS